MKLEFVSLLVREDEKRKERISAPLSKYLPSLAWREEVPWTDIHGIDIGDISMSLEIPMGTLSYSPLTGAHTDVHNFPIYGKTPVDNTRNRHPHLSRGLANYLVIPPKTTTDSLWRPLPIVHSHQQSHFNTLPDSPGQPGSLSQFLYLTY